MKKKLRIINVLGKIMRFTCVQMALLVLFGSISYAHESYSQDILNQPVSISAQSVEMKKILADIEKQTTVKFIFSNSTIKASNKITFSVASERLSVVLTKLLTPLSISYEVVGSRILLKKADMRTGAVEEATESKKVENIHLDKIPAFIITGTVTDEKGEPLIGASVVLDGTTKGTITDANGKFTLELAEADKKGNLTVSFIGYDKKTVAIEGRTIITIALSGDKILEEVVVVGYGEIKKSDLTGAVTSVKVDEKMAAQNVSMDKLLQGRAAGVEVVSGNGAPGSVINVRIRGTSTLTGNTEPLYVVDGIIMNATGEVRQASTNGNYSQESQNGLTALNPQDIETIEILKDASATAIYGSRGANGVVLVTTKKGKAGKTAVNFRASTDVSRVSKKIEVLNGEEFALMANEFSRLNNTTPRYSETPSGLDSLKTIDWFDYSFRDAVSQNYRLSFSGKAQNTNFYLAGGFTDFQGAIKNTGLKKGDLRLNLIQDVNSRFKVTSNTSMIYQVNNWTQGTERLGTANSSMVRSILRKSPLIGFDTISTILEDEFLLTESPQTWFEQFEDKSKEFRLLSALNFDYKLSKILSYRMVLGGDVRNKTRTQYFGNGLFMGLATNGRATYSSLDYVSTEIQNLLMINPKLGKKHNLSGTVGVTYDKNLSTQASTVAENFFTPALGIDGFSLGQGYYPLTIGKVEASVLSALARAVYSYDNRYFLTMTGRADGSSKFAKGNQFGFFPSFALAWKVSNERFFKQFKAVSDLKLRLGWGQTGVQTIGSYQTKGLYNATTYPTPTGALGTAQTPARIANQELTWETSEQFNAGLDAGFLKNRLKFTVDVYKKTSIDLLQNFPIAPSNGFSNVALNFGSIENKGVDIMLDGIVIEKPFKLSIGGNISFNRNKLLNLGLTPATRGTQVLVSYTGQGISTSNLQTPANLFAEGKPVAMFWGYQTNGIVQIADVNQPTYKSLKLVPGDVKFVDQNADGIINDFDKTFIGNPNPDFTYGFNTSIGYKSLRLDLFFTGVFGRDIVNANYLYEGYITGQGSNVRRETYLEAWRPTKESNTFPRLGYAVPTELSDRFVEDGSYLRLSNINLSYMITPKNKRVFSSVEFFVSGRNLVLLTKYKGFDPDVNSFTGNGSLVGVDFNSYPNTKAVNIGFSANF